MGVYKNNNGTLQPIAGRGGALIDDTSTTTSNTWSASKMNNTFVTDANYTHTDNNYTSAEKSKLDSVATGAEVNVQSDWEVTDNTSDAYIKNKPTVPEDIEDLSNVSISSPDNGDVLTYNSTTQRWENMNPILVPWGSGTDEEITRMITAYYADEITLADVQSVWSIGDVRNITVDAIATTGTANGNTWSVGESHRSQTVQIQILDFNHDTLTIPINGHAKALITVDQKNCLRDASVTDDTGSSNTEHGYINNTNTNVGGWTSCARRKWCNGGYYSALPSYLKTLVKPVNKLTSAGNQSDVINTDSDYTFFLSEIEIFGTITYSKAGEGSQYAWYANAAANRYKLPRWYSSRVSDIWWERSPYGSNSTYFCFVYNNGNADGNDASAATGLAPAFCL